jgi:hypothetical protein
VNAQAIGRRRSPIARYPPNNIVPGLGKITVLNTFARSEECQIERNRIAFEMAAAIRMTVILLLPVDCIQNRAHKSG